jgi:hypothetical protein
MLTKYPPQVSFSEAVRIIKDIYKTYKDREVSEDLLPEIFKVRQKSSYFPATITALQKFGLVTKKPKGILELTDLAIQIINPIGDEDIEAKHIAVRKDEVLSSFLEKYPNYTLPSPEQTKQTLIKLFGIDRKTVDRWYQFVIDSFRELSLKRNIVVNDNISLNDEQYKSTVSKISEQVLIPKGFQNFELPSGKKFTFSLEDGLTLDDLDFITDFFDLKKKRLGKGN